MAQSYPVVWRRHINTHYWAFWYAVCFLTRLPTPYLKRLDQEVERTALWYYPLVGVLLGALMISLVLLCGLYNPQASALVVAALVLTLWVYSTGALHLDGVADMGDAWVGGLGSLDRTLEIMKDPRIGSMGAASMLMILLLKFAALHSLLVQANHQMWLLGALCLIPALARTGILALMATLDYVRPNGMSQNLQGSPLRVKFLLLSGALIGLSIYVLPNSVLPMLVAWGVFFVGYRALLKKRLGGYTGDTLGAAVEVQEVILLLALVL